ncbi:hypothetical protein BH20ACT15_BH20ACT15_05230 [soil metagenome]
MSEQQSMRMARAKRPLGWFYAVRTVLTTVVLVPICVFVSGVMTPAGDILECDTGADACDSHFEIALLAPPVIFLAYAFAARGLRGYLLGIVLALSASGLASFPPPSQGQ